MQEIIDEVDILQVLAFFAKRESQGACLKVRDVYKVRTAVDKLIALGIPVLTLVTDLTAT
jgi:LacI family transcriptional regulator